MPAFIAPQIPTLAAAPPSGQVWIHEIKHDGFRTLIRIDRSQAQAFTRNGHDWSDKYQRVTEACSQAPLPIGAHRWWDDRAERQWHFRLRSLRVRIANSPAAIR
jgi:hypothetical protein